MTKEDKFSIKLRKISDLVREKKELEEKVEKLTALVNRLLDHITEDMIYSSQLWTQVRKAKHKAGKGERYAENR